jgi:hypothetical protein
MPPFVKRVLRAVPLALEGLWTYWRLSTPLTCALPATKSNPSLAPLLPDLGTNKRKHEAYARAHTQTHTHTHTTHTQTHTHTHTHRMTAFNAAFCQKSFARSAPRPGGSVGTYWRLSTPLTCALPATKSNPPLAPLLPDLGTSTSTRSSCVARALATRRKQGGGGGWGTRRRRLRKRLKKLTLALPHFLNGRSEPQGWHWNSPGIAKKIYPGMAEKLSLVRTFNFFMATQPKPSTVWLCATKNEEVDFVFADYRMSTPQTSPLTHKEPVLLMLQRRRCQRCTRGSATVECHIGLSGSESILGC